MRVRVDEAGQNRLSRRVDRHARAGMSIEHLRSRTDVDDPLALRVQGPILHDPEFAGRFVSAGARRAAQGEQFRRVGDEEGPGFRRSASNPSRVIRPISRTAFAARGDRSTRSLTFATSGPVAALIPVLPMTKSRGGRSVRWRHHRRASRWIVHNSPSRGVGSTRRPPPALAVLVSIGLARPWTSCSTSNPSRAIVFASMDPPIPCKVPRVATVTAAEDPSPAPLGPIERTSSHNGPEVFAFAIAAFTYRYRGSSIDPPSALHSGWGLAYTSARRLMAVARAGSPKTTACSPKRISFPGAEAAIGGDSSLPGLTFRAQLTSGLVGKRDGIRL